MLNLILEPFCHLSEVLKKTIAVKSVFDNCLGGKKKIWFQKLPSLQKLNTLGLIAALLQSFVWLTTAQSRCPQFCIYKASFSSVYAPFSVLFFLLTSEIATIWALAAPALNMPGSGHGGLLFLTPLLEEDTCRELKVVFWLGLSCSHLCPAWCLCSGRGCKKQREGQVGAHL